MTADSSESGSNSDKHGGETMPHVGSGSGGSGSGSATATNATSHMMVSEDYRAYSITGQPMVEVTDDHDIEENIRHRGNTYKTLKSTF